MEKELQGPKSRGIDRILKRSCGIYEQDIDFIRKYNIINPQALLLIQKNSYLPYSTVSRDLHKINAQNIWKFEKLNFLTNFFLTFLKNQS